MTHDFKAWTPPPGAVVAPPVHPETIVAVIYSDRSEDECVRAYELNWSAVGDGPRVVAYAVVEEYKPAPDEGWSEWRTDISEWNVSTHDVRFECVGGIHKISTRPRSEAPEPAREVVAWAVVKPNERMFVYSLHQNAVETALHNGGTVVKLTGVMSS